MAFPENLPPIDPSSEEELPLGASQGEQEGAPPMPGELDDEARAILAEVLRRAQRENEDSN